MRKSKDVCDGAFHALGIALSRWSASAAKRHVSFRKQFKQLTSLKREAGMKSARRAVLLLSLIFVFGESFAQTEGATAMVQSLRTYGNGGVLVTGFSFSTTTCNNGSFFIPGDHPHLSKLLSMILTAKATGTPITVVAKTDCSGYPEITRDDTTYVFVGS